MISLEKKALSVCRNSFLWRYDCNVKNFRNTVYSTILLISIFFPQFAFGETALICFDDYVNGEKKAEFEYSIGAECRDCYDQEKVRQEVLNFIQKGKCDQYVMLIYGSIYFEDFATFYFFDYINDQYLKNRLSPYIVAVELDSDGGFVDPAIDIAGYVSDYDVNVQGKCYSACVLILAGAKRRLVLDDTVGIHRLSTDILPSNIDRTAEGINKYFDDTWSKIEELFQSNNINVSLVQHMRSIPSNDMRILTRQEMLDAGLGPLNVAHHEVWRYKIKDSCGDNEAELYDSISSKFKNAWENIESGSNSHSYLRDLRDIERRCQ